jgi:hypothetical protein
MSSNQAVVSIGLLREVFTSEFTPELFAGAETHDPALRLVAQLVRHTDDDALIEALSIMKPIRKVRKPSHAGLRVADSLYT